jgi:hypothetical protein
VIEGAERPHSDKPRIRLIRICEANAWRYHADKTQRPNQSFQIGHGKKEKPSCFLYKTVESHPMPTRDHTT